MKYIVFDTETTGLSKTKIVHQDYLNEWPYIVQFSYIVYCDENHDIILTNDQIVKLPTNITISDENASIHRITTDIMLQKGINIDTVVDKFFDTLKNIDCIVGHNIEFDINMLKIELLRTIYDDDVSIETKTKYKKYLYTLNTHKNIKCTLKNSIQLCNIAAVSRLGKPYLKWPKLIELYEKLFNEKPVNLHNSFTDVLVTLRCFVKMEQNKDILEISEKFKTYFNNCCK